MVDKGILGCVVAVDESEFLLFFALYHLTVATTRRAFIAVVEVSVLLTGPKSYLSVLGVFP